MISGAETDIIALPSQIQFFKERQQERFFGSGELKRDNQENESNHR